MTLKSSKHFTVKKRQKLIERILDAYDKGFRDGYEIGLSDWQAYEKDMADMAEERKEIGVI